MPPRPRKIAIANRKGGSGKTTTAVNISSALALRGHRVLLVDMDPQANASLWMGVNLDSVKTTVYELLLGMEADTRKAVIATGVERMDILPAAVRLAGAEVELATLRGRELRLKQVLDPVAPAYDYVIVDCPVSFGILALNAFVACGEVLAPVQTHHLSVVAIRQLDEIVRKVNQSLNKGLTITGLAPTMVDRRMKISEELIEQMEKEYGRNLLRPSIRLDAKLAEAPAKHKPIHQYAPKSNGAFDYTALADDIRVM
ncbi:MAG: ParA family protein [Nitrospinae bacterium]|nr:ParA family protein [Nitrospinota bacterium]